MSDFNKSYQTPNRGDSDHQKPSKDVAAEVKKMIATGKNDFQVLQQLRSKYNDRDFIEAVYDGYKDRMSYITRKARKFKALMFDRYGSQNLSFPQLLKKARKYKQKYELDDTEFSEFLNLALVENASAYGTIPLPNTAMSKALGYANLPYVSDKLHVKEKELGVLQDILRLHGETKALHANVVIQSLTYQDCSLEALSGRYNQELHNIHSYVSPIVAALFIPRNQLLDEHMLIANLANIVKSRHDGKPISTQPEYELYWSIISDPNDMVCDMSSPLTDLKNRIHLQGRLWDSVLNLRQGKYYDDRLTQFMIAVDNCRNNIYDMPDMTYVRDEGTILRRLLSAFSIRPTMVATTPLYTSVANVNTRPMNLSQVTKLPMITVRIPVSFAGNVNPGAVNQVPVNLVAANTQAQWYIENKMIVPKNQSVLNSTNVIFYYVPRRYHHITYANTAFNFTQLPKTVTGFEKLNNYPVDVAPTVPVGGDNYVLRSVVFVDTAAQPNGDQMIVGSSTGIFCPVTNGYHLYDPKNPTQNPISPLTREAFYTAASERGTIFMYDKTEKK